MNQQVESSTSTSATPAMLHAWETGQPAVPAAPVTQTQHNVFESPDLLARLFMHQTELGYKVGTYYIACVTAYVALTGFAVQQYFANVNAAPTTSMRIAAFGLVLSLMSLAAPIGLAVAVRHIRRIAKSYSDALGLPTEEFSVIRFGQWLSLAAFVAIGLGWAYLLSR